VTFPPFVDGVSLSFLFFALSGTSRRREKSKRMYLEDVIFSCDLSFDCVPRRALVAPLKMKN
jgi:hypothetical protein